MFMLKVYKNITGYVKFTGKGVFPERFLNLCAKENILVWNPKVNVNEISGCMYINDYKRISKIAKKSCMRLKIVKRIGLPFIVHRYRHRYGIPIGAALFFLLIWYLSGFCFNITISGNTTVDTAKTIQALKECGVYTGRRITDIDTELTRQKFLLNNQEYAWAAINIKGCFVTVELTETTQKQMRNEDTDPCNIIANIEGKILKVKAYEGEVSVKIGEAVAKGDLLVSGIIELTNKTTKFVHADAEVIAQTRHKLKVFVPFKNEEKLLSDKTYKRSVLSVANIDIPLYLGGIDEPYKVKKTEKTYTLGGIDLPFKKTTAYFTKINVKNITLDEESAKQLAIDKMKKKADKELGDTITNEEKGEFSVTDKGVYYTKIFICEENIAITKKILKNPAKK